MKTKAPEKIYLHPYSTDGIYEVETKPFQKNGGNLFGNQDEGLE